MAFKRWKFDLSKKYSKKVNFEGYGFYIRRIPKNLDAFIIIHQQTNNTIDLTIQHNVPRKKFKDFTFSNVKEIKNEELIVYVADTPEDFESLPKDNSLMLGLLEEISNKL